MPQPQTLPPDYTVEEAPEAADRLTPPPYSSVGNPGADALRASNCNRSMRHAASTCIDAL